MGPERNEFECENCGHTTSWGVYKLSAMSYQLSRPRPILYNVIRVCGECGAVNGVESHGVRDA